MQGIQGSQAVNLSFLKVSSRSPSIFEACCLQSLDSVCPLLLRILSSSVKFTRDLRRQFIHPFVGKTKQAFKAKNPEES